MGHNINGHFLGHVQFDPGLLLFAADLVKDHLLRLFSEALQLLDLSFFRSFLEIFQAGDVQMVEEKLDPFRPQSGYLHQPRHLRRDAFFELLQMGKPACFDDLPDFPGQVLSDSGKLGQILLLFHHGWPRPERDLLWSGRHSGRPGSGRDFLPESPEDPPPG